MITNRKYSSCIDHSLLQRLQQGTVTKLPGLGLLKRALGGTWSRVNSRNSPQYAHPSTAMPVFVHLPEHIVPQPVIGTFNGSPRFLMLVICESLHGITEAGGVREVRPQPRDNRGFSVSRDRHTRAAPLPSSRSSPAETNAHFRPSPAHSNEDRTPPQSSVNKLSANCPKACHSERATRAKNPSWHFSPEPTPNSRRPLRIPTRGARVCVIMPF